MANYSPVLRSNPFRVKDREAFAAWLEDGIEGELDVDFIRDEPDQLVMYGYSDVPSHDQNGEEIDFFAVLASHLKPDDVALVFGIGSEKLRYLVGFAYAVHSSGDVIEVNLNQIYREAAENFPGCTITEAW
ncbi:hypothetical protein AKJ29_01665 [Aliiroseovarius crassostreae]|uniref:Uncharacterized protein n=2 Tax=Aliiroseovarius crassostreae TaxID=154981 RepID=A0A0P7IUZ9_9RHOB|nr:hypothetical protein [Aliiroseovarius crassostreae]KPN62877.1 hypothetical protein AKJ29_01665 [Aliiroseovarius crassostreae]